MSADPHAGGRVARGGAPLSSARLAMIMAHGRGGGAADMLGLADDLALPDIACLASQVAGNSWWPRSFLAPLGANEPGLSSGLAAIERVARGLEARGFAPERTAVLGFSQGACLALEYAARAGRPFHAIVGLSGGLVGTADAEDDPSDDLYGHAACGRRNSAEASRDVDRPRGSGLPHESDVCVRQARTNGEVWWWGDRQLSGA